MPSNRIRISPNQAKVLRALIELGPSTGYAVAKHAAIARANTYDSLEGLTRLGLVEPSGGKPVVYAALDRGDIAAKLLAESTSEASRTAFSLGIGDEIDIQKSVGSNSYKALSMSSHVVAAATQSVRAARTEVLAVVGPWVASVYDALHECRARGCSARIVALGSPAPEGSVIREVPERELTAYWGGLPVAIVADRRRAVCAVVAREAWSGVDSTDPGLVPFIRHLLRRELAAATVAHVSSSSSHSTSA